MSRPNVGFDSTRQLSPSPKNTRRHRERRLPRFTGCRGILSGALFSSCRGPQTQVCGSVWAADQNNPKRRESAAGAWHCRRADCQSAGETLRVTTRVYRAEVKDPADTVFIVFIAFIDPRELIFFSLGQRVCRALVKTGRKGFPTDTGNKAFEKRHFRLQFLFSGSIYS